MAFTKRNDNEGHDVIQKFFTLSHGGGVLESASKNTQN